ncbi:LexA family transcriptional regulator [Candidatus Shapirobacteria bacterium]|nr:LexA family transcriptional regulator [Candidatus Shapirobacteria bacterium]
MDNSQRLEKAKEFYSKHRRFPSYAEMLKLFGLVSKNAIYKIVQKWVEEGLVAKINRKLSPTPKLFSLPLLGFVKAGFPAAADEELDFLSLEDYLVAHPESSFLLKVRSDSLNGIGILPGDLVVVEKRTQASAGDVVLARIDSEWTLKILQKEKEKAVLVSANPIYPPFYPQEELQIFGIVKGVARKL